MKQQQVFLSDMLLPDSLDLKLLLLLESYGLRYPKPSLLHFLLKQKSFRIR